MADADGQFLRGDGHPKMKSPIQVVLDLEAQLAAEREAVRVLAKEVNAWRFKATQRTSMGVANAELVVGNATCNTDFNPIARAAVEKARGT